ncbi:unnamed protein product [Mytilus coruscus]|uniref:Reverse transcriptase domain-containing protein n=1 Tax=Mytilus coruscus TaxID=42192 RepID=A0A6J8CB16_MYTCO|nr:unnamed protein product [Mytilus coruscus]
MSTFIMTGLVSKRRSIFSKGPTDIGLTYLMEHEIQLPEDKPFSQPYKRIPPALFDEVREHEREMLDAGCIRESNSSQLESIFSRLKHHGLKLKGNNCEFFKKEIKYFEVIVSADGIKTDLEKITAVRNWPAKESIKDLHRFIGFTSYYRKFIKDYAKIAKPLNDLFSRTPYE